MRAWLRSFLLKLWRKLERKPDPIALETENRLLTKLLSRYSADDLAARQRESAYERIGELVEARQMAGTGPWRASAELLADTDRVLTLATEALGSGGGPIGLREGPNIVAQGATGDIELALQNVEWRREVNLSWLEFSRWGIQQLILISRLHYVKNPWIQKGINTAAHYVFGRGFEVTSEDEDANDELKAFFERNKRTLGQTGLSELHKRTYYDGQIFFACFADTQDTGETNVRTIDATEIHEIITNPDDTDEPWLYHRKWTQKVFDPQAGQNKMEPQESYYPALNWDPKESSSPAAKQYVGLKAIGSHPIQWDTPVLHMKGGIGVSKWHFDCPKVYAALDWAKAGRQMLEHCATVRKALAQIAMTISTKGGQAAVEGIKSQLGTTVGPTSNLWDGNPPPIAGSTLVSGPGTTLSAFNTRSAGGDPSDVKEYRNMVACVLEIPPTWLGDMETSNLSTAQTLDRPTELGMLEKQERWREVLVTLAIWDLKVSAGAPNGKLRERLVARKTKLDSLRIMECARVRKPNGEWVYEAKKQKKPEDLSVKCTFPAIREGDQAINIKSIAEAMTLDNKGGQVVGIDEKEGVVLLYEELGVENARELADKQYPETGDNPYDPDRTKVPLTPPIGKILPDPGGLPQAPGGSDQTPSTKPVAAAERLLAAVQTIKEKRNGHQANGHHHG